MIDKHEPLIVSEVFKITDIGTGVFFEHGPHMQSLGPVFVRVTPPSGGKFEIAANLEAARRNQGEVMAMIFRELELSDIPAGSIIQILRRQPAG